MDVAENALAPQSRYAQPRVLINWNRNPRLASLKMLAWVIYDREGVRSAATLEQRVDALCERVLQTVLGEPGHTLQSIKEQTQAEQGAAITGTKLLQRADKTDRYCEFNDYRSRVEQAFAAVVVTAGAKG